MEMQVKQKEKAIKQALKLLISDGLIKGCGLNLNLFFKGFKRLLFAMPFFSEHEVFFTLIAPFIII
ncbi:hypothetical protein [Paenibacillus periandrae]|uniref:hypothetical protein n=1 Tax=Paenibacillus periandrae TaxID=1761741 RepID=UPI001F09CE03|nr:hypothetical protein [Paenibacillus periandrae]